MTIAETENEIVEELSMFDQWDDKYQYIIDLGKSLAPLDAQYKTDDRLIKGCQSKVWLLSELKDGNIVYSADSDSVFVKGVIALLIRVLSGHSPKEILDEKLDFINQINLQQFFSMTRGNGLVQMIKQMRLDAFALSAKTQ